MIAETRDQMQSQKMVYQQAMQTRPLALFTESMMILLTGSTSHTALVDLVSLMAQTFPAASPALYLAQRGRRAMAYSALDPHEGGRSDAARVFGDMEFLYEHIAVGGRTCANSARVDMELMHTPNVRVVLSINDGIHRQIFNEWAKYLTAAIAKIMDNELLLDMAFTDGLTGLLNYRAFREILSSEVDRARRYGTTFSLMMVDIDHFKRVNDTYGHQMGDKVLVSIASRLQRRIRKSDLVFRYGGEEFMVLLPETGMYKALTLAERVRAFVERMRVDESLAVTISVGVSQYEQGMEARDIVESVDRGLYLAKGKGRNRVEIFRLR